MAFEKIKRDNESANAKSRFLSNKHHKCQLITILDQFLSGGHKIYVCKGDANTTIVSKSLEESKRCPVTVVADDTYCFRRYFSLIKMVKFL